MTETREINPLLKTLLELGPVVLFFVGYLWVRDETFRFGDTDYDGFIVVTAAFVPLILLTTFLLWRLTGSVSRMQLVTAVLVVIFGGLSVWLNDERFFKMKPTMIYLLFAAVLGAGLLRGESYLRHLMGDMLPMHPEGWMKLTRRMTAFFAGLAVLNEFVWRTMSTDAWVTFKTFGLTAAVFLFFITQSGLFTRYGIDDADGD